MLVLDTDHMSFLQFSMSDHAVELARRLRESSDEACTTIVTYEEQTRGWMAYMAKARSISAQVEAYGHLQTHLQNYRRIRVLNFDHEAASIFENLRRARLRVGTMDLKIAAICLRNDALLLTHNAGDFSRVSSLKIDDWSTPRCS